MFFLSKLEKRRKSAEEWDRRCGNFKERKYDDIKCKMILLWMHFILCILIVIRTYRAFGSFLFFIFFLPLIDIFPSYLFNNFFFLLWMYISILLYVPIGCWYGINEFWRTIKISQRNERSCWCPRGWIDVHYVCCWGGAYVSYSMSLAVSISCD